MAHDFTESAQDTVALASRHRSREPAQSDPELYAALDLGTNSCRMLIAAPDGGHFRVVDAFAKSVRLGSGLERTGHLSRGAIARTLAALEICAEKLERLPGRATCGWSPPRPAGGRATATTSSRWPPARPGCGWR